jgi:hypothetical protein
MSVSIPEELRSLAAGELDSVIGALPKSAMERLVLFIEATRVVDYESIIRPLLRATDQLPPGQFDLAMWGWKFLAARCLSPVPVRNGCPLMESTLQSRAVAMAFLQQFGRADCVRRVAEMVTHGLVVAERTSTGYSFTSAPHTYAQFVDTLEFDSLKRFDSWVTRDQVSSYNGWSVLEYGHFREIADTPGAFLGRAKDRLEQWRCPDVEKLMVPLLRPWDSGRGTMIGYDAIPEVDDHFLAEGLEFVTHCRNEAGIHPDLEFDGIGGDTILAVAAAVVSFHLKHVRFALLALKHKMPVSLPQSLTIWTPEDELAKGIADWSSIPHDQAEKALRALTLRASETAFLETEPLVPIPLLIGLDNNTLIRPVASISRNPLIPTMHLWHLRDRRARHAVREHREEWLRRDLYAMFQGRRYACVDGAVQLRDDQGRTVTDVDAAILDRTTGDLALFQLKWQDSHSNDVRALRSRASNLATEIDDWADKVGEWLRGKRIERLMSSFRFTASRDGYVRAVGLFAVSRSMSRADGYGYAFRNRHVAIANLPQLLRVRREVGPVPAVLPKMHSLLRAEAATIIESKPLRTEMTIMGRTLVFHDMWRGFPDEEDDIADKVGGG